MSSFCAQNLFSTCFPPVRKTSEKLLGPGLGQGQDKPVASWDGRQQESSLKRWEHVRKTQAPTRKISQAKAPTT